MNTICRDIGSSCFNFGTDGATAGAKTYLWDNVEFYSSVGFIDLAKATLQIFPNPALDVISISLPASINAVNANYSVSDLTGRVVLNDKLLSKQLNISMLPKGVYSLQVITENGIINKSFVKQ